MALIETDRLVIRLADAADVPEIIRYYGENRDHLQPFSPVFASDFLDKAVWLDQVGNRAQEMAAGAGFRAFLFPRAAPSWIIGNLNLTQVHRGAFQSCVLGYNLAAALAGGLGLVLVQVLTGQVNLFVIIRVIAEGIALGLCLNGRQWVVVPGIFAAASLAFAGHAAAVHPPAGAIFTDAIHVLSAGVWAGGILVLATLTPPGGGRGTQRRSLLARFGRVAFLAFAITALTGVLRASEAVGRPSDLWATPYGLVLSAKTVVVLVMVGMSALVWRRGFRLARLEGVLVLLIIAATAALAAFPIPPRPGIESFVMATVKEVMNETL